jgi:hypothetical protein
MEIGTGNLSGVFGSSDNEDSVKLEPMRESDPALGLSRTETLFRVCGTAFLSSAEWWF